MAASVNAYAQQGLQAYLEKHKDIKLEARLAKIYLSNDHPQEAYRLLKQVTEQLPNLNRPHLYLGDLYGAKNDTAKMLECYYRGAKTDPTDFLADVKLGNYYQAVNDTAKANKYYQAGYHKWSTIFPDYAVRTAIIYQLPRSIHNAILPEDMLQYIKSYRKN